MSEVNLRATAHQFETATQQRHAANVRFVGHGTQALTGAGVAIPP